MLRDYMYQKASDGKVLEDGDGRNKKMIGIDRQTKWISAIVAQKKGVDAYAIGAVGLEIGNARFTQVIIESDPEPARRKLRGAVKDERAEEVNIGKKVIIFPEKPPVAESRADGEVERYVQTAQGQVRTLKMALETRFKTQTANPHNVLPWLVMYAAMLINICSVGEDVKTAYE